MNNTKNIKNIKSLRSITSLKSLNPSYKNKSKNIKLQSQQSQFIPNYFIQKNNKKQKINNSHKNKNQIIKNKTKKYNNCNNCLYNSSFMSSSSRYYFSPQKNSFNDFNNGNNDYQVITKLQKRIKSLKATLRASEQHNEQLHRKVQVMKQNHDTIINKYQLELQQQRLIYQALAKKYQNKTIKLKQTKHSYKKLSKSRSDDGLQSQIVIQNLKNQNRSLQNQLSFQSNAISQLQAKINKLHIQQGNQKLKKTEQNHMKSQQLMKTKKYNQQLLEKLQAYRKQNDQLKKVKHENQRIKLQIEQLRIKMQQVKLKLQRKEEQLLQNKSYIQDLLKISDNGQYRVKQLQQQLKTNNSSYQQLLQYSYELQKDFQRQLHSIAKQLSRRQIINKNYSNSNNINSTHNSNLNRQRY